jgi:hypothetical protein
MSFSDPGVGRYESLSGVVSSNNSTNNESAREQFTRRIGTDEEHAKLIQKQRERALDQFYIPKLLLKDLVMFGLLLKFIKFVLRRIISNEGTVSKLANLVAVGSFVWKIRAPSKYNKHLRNGLPTYPIIGALPEIMKHQDALHGILLQAIRNVNFQSVEITLPAAHMLFLMDARDREHVLRSRFTNYVKNLPEELNSFDVGFAELFGRGIFAVDGAEWSDHRKIGTFKSNILL